MHFEVVVVGGGSTGTAIAYYLAREGAGRVALVEKAYAGWGMTGRSTAVVRLHYSTREVASMALRSWEVLRDMERVVGGPSGFRATGFVILAGREDAEGLRRNVEMHRQLGIDSRLLSPGELKELVPQINPEGLELAAYEPGSGFADPVATAQSFAKAAQQMGCTLMEGCEVKSARFSNNRVERLETSRGVLSADIVVNASGVWCNRFLDMLGIELPVRVVKEEIVVWKRPEDFSGEHLVVGDLPLNYYMRPFGWTQSYMGSINPDMSRQEKYPEAFNLEERVGVETAYRYGEAVSTRFPAMAHASFAGGWVGLYDVTPDWHPIIGFSRKLTNLFNAVGLSGHGFKLAPAIGMLSAEIILGRKPTNIDHKFFSETRFEENRLVGRTYQYGVIS
jgi:sarcosine oxidase subunit beta